MAPNDLTPCRMAFYFVSTLAIAQTPTKQPGLRLSRTKNLHFAKAPFPGFSASDDLNQLLESVAQRYSALITAKLSEPLNSEKTTRDYHSIDIHHVEAINARSVGAETLVMHAAAQQLQLDEKLTALGFNKKQEEKLAGSRYFCESLFWASQPKQAAKT